MAGKKYVRSGGILGVQDIDLQEACSKAVQTIINLAETKEEKIALMNELSNWCEHWQSIVESRD